MEFYIYDVSFLIIFTLAVIIFLYKRRKNLKREGVMYLYKTQVGIKFINYVGEKYKKTLKVFSLLAVISGYILMSSMIYFLINLIYIYLFRPDIVKLVKIPPLMPLIPYLPEAFKIDFLPPFYFTYWIIAIAVIAVFHEFSHGIIARRYNVKIKTTGFGFLGPFLAAFVEPDEEEMNKKPKFQQIAILSAGTFTNLILAGIFLLLLSLFFTIAYVPAGAVFNTYTPGIVKINSITKINGILVNNSSSEGILDLIDKNNISNDLILGDDENSLNLTKITSNNKSYFISIDELKKQLEDAKINEEIIVLYENLPAINLGLKGIIIQINENKIKDYDSLSEIMKNYKPGDKIKIKTKDKENIIDYELTLAEDPNEKRRAVIGIGHFNRGNSRLIGKIFSYFKFFENSRTYYEPRFNTEFTIFVYNLIWWLALINLSVALINMWPVAIFDGGRMFMLTIWAITKSEKFAQIAFRFITYVILGSLLLLMWGWFAAVF